MNMETEELRLPLFDKALVKNKNEFAEKAENIGWYNEVASVKNQSLVNQVSSLVEEKVFEGKATSNDLNLNSTDSNITHSFDQYVQLENASHKVAGSGFNPFGLATLFPIENIFTGNLIDPFYHQQCYGLSDYYLHDFSRSQSQSYPSTYEHITQIDQNTTKLNRKLAAIKPRPEEGISLYNGAGNQVITSSFLESNLFCKLKRKRKKKMRSEKQDINKTRDVDFTTYAVPLHHPSENDISMEDVDEFIEMMNPTDNTENKVLTSANHRLHEETGTVEDEVIDRTNMKPIENLKEECLTKMVEGETEDSDDAEIELMLTKLLPDAFSIWKEKYRALVKEEYPEASKTTIEDKLREIWKQIPAEHRQKYYDKANAMIKRYRLSLGSCSLSKARKKRALKSHIKPRSKETTVLKPKPIKARRISSECAEDDGWQSTEECAQEYKYDYSKALKETMTYNSPDKTVKKKLAKMKVRDTIMDFTDENGIATGFLQDIMIASNIAENRSEYNNEDFVFNDGSLDVGELESYLSGGDEVFGRCDELSEEINLRNHQMKQIIDVRGEKKRRNRMTQRERRKKKRKLRHALAKYCDVKEIRTENDGGKNEGNNEELTEQYHEGAITTATCQDGGSTDEENKSTNDSPGMKANECITGKQGVVKETYDTISTNVHVSFDDNIHDGDEKIAQSETCNNVDSGTENLSEEDIQKEDYINEIDGTQLIKENHKIDNKDEIKDEVEEDRLAKEDKMKDFINTTNGKEEQHISEEEGKEKMDEKKEIERKIKNVKKQKSSTRLRRRTSKRTLNPKQK